MASERFAENAALLLPREVQTATRPDHRTSTGDARASCGGGALEGTRYIWRNYVSSRRERIEQAKEDWKMGRFTPVPGETESIPLPEL